MFIGAMTKQYARDSNIIGTSQYQKCLRVQKVLYDMHQVLANINVTRRSDKVIHLFKTCRKASLENKSKYPFTEAVNTAVYLRNRSRTTALKEITPYEQLFKKKLNVANLKVFGCISFVHVPNNQRKKLEARSRKAMFVGYPDSVKGCQFYDPVSSKSSPS